MPPRKPKTESAAPAAGNGKTAAQLEQLAEVPATSATPPAEPSRILLDYDKLNMGDMMRARKMFADLDSEDPWAGSDPVLVLAETWEGRQALTIWCFQSRTDPTFTWAQACAVDFGDLDLPERPAEASPIPPMPEPMTDGSGSVETP